MGKRRTDVDLDEVERLYRTTKISVAELARKFGCSANLIGSNLKKRGIRLRRTGTEEQKFFDHVEVDEVSGCWNWTSTIHHRGGYGYFRYNGWMRQAYRWSYEHFVDQIPEGYEIDHLCRNKSCVNPDHLEAVTHRENQRRAPNSIINRMARGEHPRWGRDDDGRFLKAPEGVDSDPEQR